MSGRDHSQQANDDRDRTVGDGVDGSMNGSTTVDSGNNAGAVAGSGTSMAGAGETAIRGSSKDSRRQSISIRSTPTARLSERALPVSTAPPTAGTSVDPKALSAKSIQRSITMRSPVVANQTTAGGLTTSLAGMESPTPTNTAAVTRTAAAPVPVVSGFLAAVGLAPSLTSPTAPPRAPAAFVWAVLGFVRRELEQVSRTYFNRTPDARDDVISTGEDATLTFDPRTNDRDDDTLAVTAVTNGTYGNVTTDGTTVTYTPTDAADALAAGEQATDTFTYTVSDANSPWHLHGLFGLFSHGHTDTATVTVTLTGVNDAPNAVADTVTGQIGEDAAGTVIDVLSNDVDPDHGDTKTITTFTQGAYGTVTDNGDGTLSYTPNDSADALAAGETQTDSFTYTIKDGGGATSTAIVSLVLNGANDQPVAVNDTVADPIGELDGSKTIDVLANDTDPDRGDSKTITAVTNGQYGDVAINGGMVTYTPNAAAQALVAGDIKADSFTYTIKDASGAVSTATVSLEVVGVNDATVIRTDGTPVDVAWGITGDIGWIRNDDGTLTEVTRTEDGWSVGARVGVAIDAGDIALGVRYGYAYDRQDDSIAMVDLETGAEVGRAVDATTGLKYSFDDVTDVAVYSDASGTADVVYAVNTDGTVWAIDAQSKEVVGRVETAPVVTDSADMLVVNAAVARSAPTLAVSPDGSKLYVANGSRVSVISTRRTAAAQLTAASSDAAIAADTGTLEVYSEVLQLSGEVTGLAVASTSTDSDMLYATVKDSADQAAESALIAARVDIAAGAVSWVPTGSISVGRGARSVDLSASGARGYVINETDRTMSVLDLRRLEVVETVKTGVAAGVAVVGDTVLVANPDAKAVSVLSGAAVNPTVINSDTATTGEDNSVVIHVLGNDTIAEGAEVTPTVVSGPAHGSATVVDGTIRYTPNADFDGTDTFSYAVNDGTANSASATVTVTVTPAITAQLTWDDNPADLDAHLIGPSATGGGADFHVYYASKTYNVDGTTEGTADRAVFLVADDTDGYGPEVIEINTRTPGEYLYYVHKYSGVEPLAQSNAKVTVVDPNTGLPMTFTVDPNSAGTYWAVFKLTISGAGVVTLTPVDAYSDAPPTLEADNTPIVTL